MDTKQSLAGAFDPAIEQAARLAFEDNRRKRLVNLRSKLNRPGLENLAAMMGKGDRLERHPDGRYVAGSVEFEWMQWREAWTRAIASQEVR